MNHRVREFIEKLRKRRKRLTEGSVLGIGVIVRYLRTTDDITD